MICNHICGPHGQWYLRNAELFKEHSLIKLYSPGAKFPAFLQKLYGLTEVLEMREDSTRRPCFLRYDSLSLYIG